MPSSVLSPAKFGEKGREFAAPTFAGVIFLVSLYLLWAESGFVGLTLLDETEEINRGEIGGGMNYWYLAFPDR